MKSHSFLIGLGFATIFVAAAWSESPSMPRTEARPPRNVFGASNPVRDGPPSQISSSRFYPAEASDWTITGRAKVRCQLKTPKSLQDCEVVSETPVGMGFGQAAIALVKKSWRPSGRDPIGLPDGHDGLLFQLIIRAPAKLTKSSTTQAIWSRTPTGDDLSAAWSAGGRALLTGAATLRCGVSPDGKLNGCSIAGEEPRGSGFGAAALTLTGRFEVDPATRPAIAFANRDLLVGIRFFNPASSASSAPALESDIDWRVPIDQLRAPAVFPRAAIDARILEGIAQLSCLAQDDGRLTDCRTTYEQPQGMGFGAAAQSIAGNMKANPWSADGRPIGGSRVAVRFRLRESSIEPLVPQ